MATALPRHPLLGGLGPAVLVALVLVTVDPLDGTGPVARLTPRWPQNGGLVADDAWRKVLVCGPSPLIRLDGHLFLLALAEVSRTGASSDSCQNLEGGGTVNRTACGGMML